MPNEPIEPVDPKPEPKITFTTALLCQQVLKDYRGDLVSLVNIVDSVTLERELDWAEFFAFVVAKSDQMEPFVADAKLVLRYPSGKVVPLQAPEALGFGTDLSVKIKRHAGTKLIVSLRIQLSEVGEYVLIVSTCGSVAEIPFMVVAKAN